MYHKNDIVVNHSDDIGKQSITSLEIAQISGKRHTDLLRSIRKQETSWEKVNGSKFALVKYTDEKGEKRPMYKLTKMESLYIASKFNDEIRAKLVSRWSELEHKTTKGYPALPPKRNHNRLTDKRKVDILKTICKVGSEDIRLELLNKLGI